MQAAAVLAAGFWPSIAGALLASVFLGGTIMGLTALGFALIFSASSGKVSNKACAVAKRIDDIK